jgi:hypothetical protein
MRNGHLSLGLSSAGDAIAMCEARNAQRNVDLDAQLRKGNLNDIK